MKKRFINILFICFIVFGLVGCDKEESYTEGMIRARTFSPWYLSSDVKAGEIYDNALKNINWEEKDNKVIISGIDRKTNKEIVITYELKKYGIDMKEMTVNGEKKDYLYWYKYMTSYID